MVLGYLFFTAETRSTQRRQRISTADHTYRIDEGGQVAVRMEAVFSSRSILIWSALIIIVWATAFRLQSGRRVGRL